ncbi:hypothetical protein PAXINDRAFT_181181 [Paxillus involutus ATCC 200175]|uniref:Uncharacterized protein n=1 Tax=Paxillus involutus ATCC 200175 TaxID=664439 RepID=A0A0C9SW89_PAXIN|nr:hypothetical protein PAXINDRAFT_181181 [Paxillus involutus ATCC 200175]
MFSFLSTSASPLVQLDLPREIDSTAVPAVHADMLEQPSRYQGQCLDDAHAHPRRIRDEKAKAAALESAVQYPQRGEFLGLADEQIWEDNVVLYRRVRVLEMQVLEMQFIASTTPTIEEEMAVLKAERDTLIAERDELLRLDEKHTNDYFILDEEKTQVEKVLRAERRSSRHDAFKYHMELRDMKDTIGNLLDEATNPKSQATNYFTEKEHRIVLEEAFRAEKDAMAGQLEHYKMRVSTLEAVNQRDKDAKDATDALHQLTVDCLLKEKKELQSRIRGLEGQSLASCASSTEQCNAIQAELDGLRRLEEVRSIDSAARREEHLRVQSKLDWEKYRRRDDFLLTYTHLIDVDEVIATYEDQREIALKEILYYRALFDDVYRSVDNIREEVLIPPGELRLTETIPEFVPSTASLPFGDDDISSRSLSSSTPELESDYDEQSSLDSLSPTLDRYLRFEHEGKADLVLECDDVDPLQLEGRSVDVVATDSPLSCNGSPLLHIASKAPRETDHDENLSPPPLWAIPSHSSFELVGDCLNHTIFREVKRGCGMRGYARCNVFTVTTDYHFSIPTQPASSGQ